MGAEQRTYMGSAGLTRFLSILSQQLRREPMVPRQTRNTSPFDVLDVADPLLLLSDGDAATYCRKWDYLHLRSMPSIWRSALSHKGYSGAA